MILEIVNNFMNEIILVYLILVAGL